MYKVNVEPYDVPQTGQKFDVKESLVNVLFAVTEKLGGAELLRRDELGRQIAESDGVLLLEDTQFATLKGAVERFQGYGRAHVEFVKRIFDAERTKVAPVK